MITAWAPKVAATGFLSLLVITTTYISAPSRVLNDNATMANGKGPVLDEKSDPTIFELALTAPLKLFGLGDEMSADFPVEETEDEARNHVGICFCHAILSLLTLSSTHDLTNPEQVVSCVVVLTIVTLAPTFALVWLLDVLAQRSKTIGGQLLDKVRQKKI